MAQDPQSEFERIFGKAQKDGGAKAPEEKSAPLGRTQKLPSDSDLLGIRTDSDRFVVKNVPDSLPVANSPGSSESPQKAKPEGESANKASPDAMTIALNVNVFANLADAKKMGIGVVKDKSHISGTLSELLGKQPGESPGPSADGPTFVIPLPKDAGKTDHSKAVGSPENGSSVADEFTRILNPKNIPGHSSPNTEFTRVLHIEDKIQVPKPTFPVDDSTPASTIAITSDPKLPPASRQPTVITQPGPSDFTKVVKGSELRALQEKLAAAAANQAAANPAPWQSATPNPMSGSVNQSWQAGPPVPQYVPGPGAQWPSSAPASTMPTPPSGHQPSKLSQYMPLIIVLNLLVLMAILLIVFFAIKK